MHDVYHASYSFDAWVQQSSHIHALFSSARSTNDDHPLPECEKAEDILVIKDGYG